MTDRDKGRRDFLKTMAMAGTGLALEGRIADAFARSAQGEIVPVDNVRADLVFVLDRSESLYSLNSDVPLRPASLTKIVTAEPLLYAFREGKIGLDEPIPFTKEAMRATVKGDWNLNYTKLSVPAINMAQIMLGRSVNNAAASAAQFMYGHPFFEELTDARGAVFRTPEEGFVHTVMQRRSEKLGLIRSQWGNSCGLPASDTDRPNSPPNVTTAEDLAKIISHELTEYPELIRDICSLPEITVDGTDVKFANTNVLLENAVKKANRTKGVFSFKTGYIKKSGYNLVVGCERDIPFGDEKRKLLVVVITIGHASSAQRTVHAKNLNEAAFDSLEREAAHEHGMLQRQKENPGAAHSPFHTQSVFKELLEKRTRETAQHVALYQPLDFELMA